MAFRFVFGLRFKSEDHLRTWIPFWEKTSQIIQQEPGAQGTRLHRIQGELTTLAIAEWDSRESRDEAFENLKKKYPPEHLVHKSNSDFGEVFIIGNADEILSVLPPIDT